MDLLTPLPGADAVLAAHGPALPQPDQLCGPFAAWAALHAVLPEPPSVAALAGAAGTRVWPHDVADWRPTGAPWDTRDWAGLPRAGSVDGSGTGAAGLAAAVTALTDVAVVPAAGGAGAPDLLARLLERGEPVGVVANVHTASLSPELGWDVGHFVVLHAVGPHDVGIADSYRELGAPGQPPGCRVVPSSALVAGLCAGPGRGLLLLTEPGRADDTRRLVRDAGLVPEVWST